MLSFAVLAIPGLLSSAPAVVAPSGWEKVYESPAPKEKEKEKEKGKGKEERGVSAVLAFGRDDWFAGGVGWLARGTTDGAERTNTGPRDVLRLAGDAPNDVFAFGTGELVMRFDGQKWNEEHVGPTPTGRERDADILNRSFRDAESNLMAFGPGLLLVRKADRTWGMPRPAEGKRLLDYATAGPPFALPGQCARAVWFWLGRDRGMFNCRDGRSFIFDAGKVTSKGVLPRECRRAFNDVTWGQGAVFASCGSGLLWKTEGDGWRFYAAVKGEKELVSVSVTDRCVFAASTRAVWRWCGP